MPDPDTLLSPAGLAGRLTSLTRDLVLIRSTDDRPDERERCFAFVRNHLDGISGIALDEFRSGDYTSLVVRPGGVERPEVLLCGHLDVIEHPIAGPFESKVQNGRIIGPGAGDMKGAVAIMLELFTRLQRFHPGASVGLALTSDEERGGEDGVRYLFDEAGLRCGCAIVPDGGSLNELTVAEKGILHARLISRGRAAHAARPWLAQNAIDQLIAGIQRAAEHFRKLQPPELTSEDHWYPTMALTILRSPNEAVNRIPGEAEAVVDIRFTPPFTAAELLSTLRTIMEPVAVEPVISAEPTHLAPDELFVDVTREITGNPVRRVRASGGSDARFICRYGIPVLLSRPLVGGLHSEDEWIDIASMATYFQICETYIRRKLGLPQARVAD